MPYFIAAAMKSDGTPDYWVFADDHYDEALAHYDFCILCMKQQPIFIYADAEGNFKDVSKGQ